MDRTKSRESVHDRKGSDIEAIKSGEARRVNCFLRGQVRPYPEKLRQGSLTLRSGRAAWTPSRTFSRKKINFDLHVRWVRSRPADEREPNIKKGGIAFGVVPAPRFMVVTCDTPAGSVDLVVPETDEPLLKDYFTTLPEN